MLGREAFREEDVFGECFKGWIEGLESRHFSGGQEGDWEGHARQWTAISKRV